MTMLCPNCMGEMFSNDGKQAICSLDGKRYNVLYYRNHVGSSSLPIKNQPVVASQNVESDSHEPDEKITIKCSDCDQQYKVKADLLGKSVTCKKCGSAFKIELLEGDIEASMSNNRAMQSTAIMCNHHPTIAAICSCSQCGGGICGTCDFPQADGTHLCPDCVTKPKQVAPPPLHYSEPEVEVGTMCAIHPQVQATQICKACGLPICNTCDFEFPGNIHVCPNCASKPEQPLSGSRKTRLVWGYVLAVFSTLALVFFLFMAPQAETEEALEAIGIAMSVFILIPSIIGTSLSVSARDRRLTNPFSILIAILWNGIILGIFVLLNIIGILMG